MHRRILVLYLFRLNSTMLRLTQVNFSYDNGKLIAISGNTVSLGANCLFFSSYLSPFRIPTNPFSLGFGGLACDTILLDHATPPCNS